MKMTWMVSEILKYCTWNWIFYSLKSLKVIKSSVKPSAFESGKNISDQHITEVEHSRNSLLQTHQCKGWKILERLTAYGHIPWRTNCVSIQRHENCCRTSTWSQHHVALLFDVLYFMHPDPATIFGVVFRVCFLTWILVTEITFN